jgi:hypothetical protein
VVTFGQESLSFCQAISFTGRRELALARREEDPKSLKISITPAFKASPLVQEVIVWEVGGYHGDGEAG